MQQKDVKSVSSAGIVEIIEGGLDFEPNGVGICSEDSTAGPNKDYGRGEPLAILTLRI
jgi:hypothetical protein